MSDHGRFIWYELITPDVAGAKRFYGDLLGWTAEDLPAMPGAEPYSIVSADGHGVGGIMNLGEAMKAEGMPPNWTGYICVDDVDAAAAKAPTLGGSVRRPAWDIPGIGRIAILADPAGAVFAVMKPTPPPGARPEIPPGTLGAASWHELYGASPDTGFAFYRDLFGWTADETHDMGPMGKYQLFSNPDGQVGGMMRKPDQVPMPYWNYYFRVGDIDAAAARAKAGGAQILMGPVEVPSGDWVFQGADPQGAVFAVQGFKAG
jgi:predicted enzyme related to lactoylglutathione lyase